MSTLKVEICKIEEVQKHPNADKLSVVRIKGWWVITALDQYKVGDLVVYIPPDSIVPDTLVAEHKLTYLKNGNRVGTLKLRGFISQGLILSVGGLKSPTEGSDVAEELGITKWQPPSADYQQKPKETIHSVFGRYRTGEITLSKCLQKTAWLVKDRYLTPKRKLNPHFNVYTDIENIKHYPDLFTLDEPVAIMLKIHGTNARYGNLQYAGILPWRKYEFCYGSHRVQKYWLNRDSGFYEGDVYGYIAKKYNLARLIPKDTIIYGEIYGRMDWSDAEIQKGYSYGLSELRFAVFDVKYQDRYLNHGDMLVFCGIRGLPVAPTLYVGGYSPEILKAHTEGRDPLDPTIWREGCVVKPLVETHDPRIGRKILKSINPEYLLLKDTTDYH